MRLRLAALALILLALPARAQEVSSASGALLRGLDKVSGVATDIELGHGETRDFGRISITLGDCRYPVEDPSSNAYAQLKITERTGDATLFDGWMIASSPALSALDNPRYDVWVLRCITS